MADLDPGVRSLLEAPNFPSIATVLPDGAPHTVSVWMGIHEDRPFFFTQPSSRKGRNIDADPRVAVSLVDRENPYRTGSLRGTVAETLDGDPALELIDALSLKYTGEPFPMRSGRVYFIDVAKSTFLELPFEEPK